MAQGSVVIQLLLPVGTQGQGITIDLAAGLLPPPQEGIGTETAIDPLVNKVLSQEAVDPPEVLRQLEPLQTAVSVPTVRT